MYGRCIAYTGEGKICGKPACIVDQQRGGMVCDEHAPAVAGDPKSSKESNDNSLSLNKGQS